MLEHHKRKDMQQLRRGAIKNVNDQKPNVLYKSREGCNLLDFNA
jgi:hypothetical protein